MQKLNETTLKLISKLLLGEDDHDGKALVITTGNGIPHIYSINCTLMDAWGMIEWAKLETRCQYINGEYRLGRDDEKEVQQPESEEESDEVSMG